MRIAIALSRHPLALAVGFALSALAPSTHAGPAAAHWTVTDVGTLGGSFSSGYGLNDLGQVTGTAYTAGDATSSAFRYSNGVMTNLGSFAGGSGSTGYAINNAGTVTGSANTAAGTSHAFVSSGGVFTDLGTLGGNYSSGSAINSAGQVTGYGYQSLDINYHAFRTSNGIKVDLGTLGGATSEGFGINSSGQVTGYAALFGNTASHAFVYTNGQMKDIGTLGGSSSVGRAINKSGQVAGNSYLPGSGFIQHAVLYRNGAMVDLGTLGGNSSDGYAVNTGGQVAGLSTRADASQGAFLSSNGTMTDLDTVSGVATSGWKLGDARALNDAAQIVGTGTNPSGKRHAYLLTLDTTVWQSTASGTWDGVDGNTGWSYLAPGKNTSAYIDPTRSLTVTGPSADTTVKRLTIGGDSTGNVGIATLALNGGTLSVVGTGGQFTTISARGVLTGDGAIGGAVVNQGRVDAVNLRLTSGLTNQNEVTGNGRLYANLTNSAGAMTHVDANQKLLLSGTAHTNAGNIEARGGGQFEVVGTLANSATGRLLVDGSTARFGSAVTNALGGRITLRNGSTYFNGGLTNSGQLLASFGTSDVYGPVTVNSGGKIILSVNSNSAFYDTLDVKSGGELRVTTGGTAVFFGQVFKRTGSSFTGGGKFVYEGVLSVGASPGFVTDEGDITFGGGNAYLAEIGGTAAGTEYDHYSVDGALHFGGTLELVSWEGFVAGAGQRFDLFDWTDADGTFDAIDTSGFFHAAGTRLDLSKLYVDGSIGVLTAPVPEPGTYALMLAGLAAVGVAARRRGRPLRPAHSPR